jgi:hypothetical protein
MDRARLVNLAESTIDWLSRIPPKRVAWIFSIMGLLISLLFILKPSLAITIQKKIYEKINWRLEPILMGKEIRNTRLMGIFLFVFILASLYLILFTGLF